MPPRKPAIAAVFCVYNEEEYLDYAVRAVLPAVDAVILCLGLAPYTAYGQADGAAFPPDGTEAVVDALAAEFPGAIHVIKRQWSSQLEHREAGLARCLELGMDYYFLVDGDEVYREDHLATIRRTIRERPEVGTFIIKCHTFWRSFRYRILPDTLTWRPRRLFKITRHRRLLGLRLPHALRFTGINDLNSLGPVHEFHPKDAVFYHFSYARSPARMREKLLTFPHAQEILSGWYERVWLRWPVDRRMTNIHPTDPPKFPEAVAHDLSDLPEIMRRHPYYGQEIIDDRAVQRV
ncbi:MAG: glycosyltransferase family 2 protein [Candidatus Omnitrophica bacterium]|nr:glycosyltransferase family 2 protein [Candidatus Omnitrophota bacterium]